MSRGRKLVLALLACGSKRAGLCPPGQSYVEANLSSSTWHEEARKEDSVRPDKVISKKTCPRPPSTRKQESWILSAQIKSCRCKLVLVHLALGSKRAGLCPPGRSHAEANLSSSTRHREASKQDSICPNKVMQKRTCHRPCDTR